MRSNGLCWVWTVMSLGILFGICGNRISMEWGFLIMGSMVLSYVGTAVMIPKLMHFMLKAQIFGYDINKKGSKGGQKKIPQCIGFASAVSYIIVSFIFCLFIHHLDPQALNVHILCNLTIIATILLGFADDMLDLPWRYKLIFPFFIVIPSVLAYNGSTAINIPYPLTLIITHSIDIGRLYYVYLALLGIYCTNAINIYAGINGLQVGQSIIVAASQLILYAVRWYKNDGSNEYCYSIFLLTSFLGSALALMKFNGYPSKVFVGDTFCYFSGITIAISAMLSNTSIIFHLLFLPQLINFVYSFPQLIGIIPCPRHRLTLYDIEKDQLESIPTNRNLLNLSLLIIGPTNEGKLCFKLLGFQILCCSIPILLTLFNII